MRVFAICFFLTLSNFAYAEVDWRESNLWRNASVLSQGQNVWSARVGQKKIDSRYSASGTNQPLGAAYNKSWDWNQVLNAEKDVKSQQALSEYMQANGIEGQDIAATSAMDVRRDEVQMDLSWAYGVTKRWMFGFFMPLSYVKTKVSPAIKINPTTVQAVQDAQVAQNKPMLSNTEAEAVVESLIRQQVADQGFRSISETNEQWIWGDLSLLNQYLVYDDFDHKISIQQVLKIPTSRNPSLSDYIQVSRDEGQIDVGVSGYYDYFLKSSVFTVSGGYVNQLPAPVRITEFDSNSRRQSDVEVSRNLGDYVWVGAEAKYNFSPWSSVSGGYRYFDKGQDSFEIEGETKVNPGQELQVVRMVGSYVFSDSDARFDIENKWALNLQLQTSIAGKNSDELNSATLEIQTYF